MSKVFEYVREQGVGEVHVTIFVITAIAWAHAFRVWSNRLDIHLIPVALKCRVSVSVGGEVVI